MHRFKGFSPETLEFFVELKFNNDKAWFDSRRDDFEAYVKTPMEELARALEPTMAKIDPSLDLRTRRVVSRIYRDARYARGIPYRDHMFLSYKPVGKSNSQAFTYFFYIEDARWGVGLGLYDQVPDIMEGFRHRLITQGELWRELLAHPRMEPFKLEGETNKRVSVPDLAPDLAQWYAYRKFFFDDNHPIEPLLFSPELVNLVQERFLALAPVYSFVTGMQDET